MPSRLKSLELHGYKTFASRTLFEFPSDITAVVGPNGSGKSNVSDSLRWVLGEQSYSLLRARKTEDMIFSGSDQRPRAGMASATITFDNTDGWLPIDYSEVSITRRAYRDGQNEYLLNGQRVRLKEISELLAQSGLAERTYTIIGQGLVDAALSLKPEERRRFFEEAAGIGLFRSRREEALSRLDTTRRNLERVRDILSELEPRLQSLEKHARKAQEYERVKADLRVLLRDWYGYHWHKAQSEVGHAREALKAQEARQTQARAHLAEIEGQLNELREEVQQVRGKLNTWHGQSAELHRQREQVSRDLAVMDERQRALTEQQLTIQQDVNRLEDDLKAREERLAALRDERERLQADLDEAQKQVKTAQAAINARMAEREKVEQALRDARRSLVSSETQQVQIKAHQTELSQRLETLRQTRINLTAGLEKEAEALDLAKKKLEEITNAKINAENERKTAEEALQSQRVKITALEAERKKSIDERNRLEAQQTKLRAQLDVLEQADKSFSGLNQGARYLLQAARQGRFKSQLRALSSILDVPAQYETAVAAVLGEMLDGVVISDDNDLDSALGMLSQGEKGRAVMFLPGHGEPTQWQPQIDSACLGPVIELIRFPKEMELVVRRALGNVILVKDHETARNLLKDAPKNARLVTLNGEVFWGSGIVVAGLDGRQGVIGRTRQKREIQEELEALDEQVGEARQAAQKLDQQINAARRQEIELEQETRSLAQKVNQAAQMVQQASLAAEQSRQKHEWTRNQIISLDQQIKRSEIDIQEGEKTLEKAAVLVTELSERIREFNRRLNGLPLDELQSQMVHWNTNAAVASRAVQDAARRLDEQTQAVQSGRSQLSGLQTRLNSVSTALQQLVEEQNCAHTKESELAGQIDALQVMIVPAEQDLLRLEKDYSAGQANQQAAQQSTGLVERNVAQAQMELSRRREEVESLKRRIEDDFGLVAFEYSSDNAGQTPLPLEGMVEQLPTVAELDSEIEESISRQRGQLRRMGSINPDAQKEYNEVKERYEFLTQQVEDLKRADTDLRVVIGELDDLMKREFRKTFDAVAVEFRQLFTRLFGGGSARLVLVDEENPAEGGIDIEARLPGRREQGLALLSGGERSLTAVALIFSLLKVSPTPFCVMDEVDAMLDEANVGRFRDLLLELSQKTQFLVITHNRNTVQSAGVIYGVTMGRDSASQVISLKLDEVSEDMAK